MNYVEGVICIVGNTEYFGSPAGVNGGQVSS